MYGSSAGPNGLLRVTAKAGGVSLGGHLKGRKHLEGHDRRAGLYVHVAEIGNPLFTQLS